ncbi:hypothetical protein OGAPHI_000474 [Ogataea philodendri]|uniref:Uncharacterized protein n=1 Tax=Ogataea philodendri TaxID=1378263 RepID=A0A9P8T9V8_9ASCO|nr:uncharacterized protein OGAPHI_000474 [Ogataea philodendri]KAH3671251.1 hypothetical protein OGAPHI_000474 [Ogataea philodendri]
MEDLVPGLLLPVLANGFSETPCVWSNGNQVELVAEQDRVKHIGGTVVVWLVSPRVPVTHRREQVVFQLGREADVFWEQGQIDRPFEVYEF